MSFCGEDVQADHFSSYGYTGKTIIDKNRSTTTTFNHIYELRLNGIAKVSPLRQKYEIIMGSPFVQNNGQEDEIHPFFVYFIKKIMKYEALSMLKFTEYNPRVLSQLIRKEDVSKAAANDKIHQIVTLLINEINHKNQAYKLEQRTNRLLRLKLFHSQMQQAENQCWKSYSRLIEKGYVEPCLKGFAFKRKKNQMSEQQSLAVQRMFAQVNAIQPLNESYQSAKIKIFQKKHKRYYFTSLSKENGETNLNKILVKKPTHSPELLHNLEQHVRLRRPDPRMNAISAQIMRGVCQQLKKYMVDVSNQSVRYFYQFLSPTSILLDQMSLRPRISFNPLLTDAIGLRKKPLSIENSIVFFPTPQTFDYFQSLAELQYQNQLILDDPFYGCIELFGEQKARFTLDQKMTIYMDERYRLQQIKEQMMVWRFILTSHYLTHGCQFGSQSNAKGNRKIKQSFKQMLQKKMQQFKQDQNNLGMFMFGTAIQKKSIKRTQINGVTSEFKFTYQQLYNYLGLVQSQDQLIQELKFKKIKKYHLMRKFLLREVLKIFMAEHLFARLYNVKKYLIMYSVIANQVLEEAMEMLEAEKRRVGERKLLKENFDKDIRRLKDEKTYKQTLNSTFQKLLKYKARPETDIQAAYLNKHEEGKTSFNQILQIKKFLQQLGSKEQSLSLLEAVIKPDEEVQDEYERKLNEENRSSYQNLFRETYKYLSQSYRRLTDLCFKIFTTCYKTNSLENHHKFEKTNLDSKESHRLYSIEFETKVKALFLLNISNYEDYQTLIVPYLGYIGLQESQRKIQVQILPQTERREKEQVIGCIDDLLKTYQFKKQSQPDPSDKTGQQFENLFSQRDEATSQKVQENNSEFKHQRQLSVNRE